MLIPHLHFDGNCADAIALYEKVFHTKAKNFDYRDGQISHAEMRIHGQTIFLNDGKAFFSGAFGIDCAAHLVLTFNKPEELLACYEVLKADGGAPAPFHEAPYSKLTGNFVDAFGVLWGFIVL